MRKANAANCPWPPLDSSKALGDGGERRALFLVAHVFVLDDAHGRVLAFFVGDAVEYAEHADHFFLGHQAHHRGHGGLPVAKAQRLEHGRHRAADLAEDGLVGVLHRAEHHGAFGLGDGGFGGRVQFLRAHFRLRRFRFSGGRSPPARGPSRSWK